MTDLHSFCETLGFGTAEETFLLPHWEKLCKNTTDEFPSFMQKDFYERYSAVSKLSPELLPRMETVAKITAGNPACCRYANMLEYGIFKAVPMINLSTLPELVKIYGENSGIFQLMVAMASIPLTEKTHAAMGLPERYAHDSAQWLAGTVEIYSAAHNGIPGHTFGQTPWLRHNVDGKLFRIGRLEYLLGHWGDFYQAVYINRKDHSIAVLCSDQSSYDKDGFRTAAQQSDEAVFTARIKVLENHVTGTPVMPNGFPRTGRKITLDLNEWEPLCAPWDQIPSLHIPGGGGMTPEKLKESMLEARQFFHKYFATDVKAFVCGSWIFGSAWDKELPDSNLAAFQRNVYMTSIIKHPDVLFFVYGRSKGDPREWQCTTALHKAICRIIDRGESLTVGHMFILASDLEKFGTEYYRKKYQF